MSKDLILKKKPDEVVTVHTDRKIMRKRKEVVVPIVSEADDKIYRVSFSTRKRLHDNSVPFGYFAELPWGINRKKEDDIYVMYEWLGSNYPFTCIISGPNSSGKLTFCINLWNLDACTEQI